MVHQPTALKILAIGSPLSELSATVSKITAINAKHGPFDACVLVGDVFNAGSDGSEVDGISFPVPTYFTLGRYELPANVQARIEASGGEVVDNLVFLGKSTILTTAQGLKIGCVGGSYDEGMYASGQDAGVFSPIITKPSVDAYLSNPLFNPSSEPSLASARESAVSLPSAFQGVDLLLLSSPPPSLSLLSPAAASLPFPLAHPVPPLGEVVTKSRPRYIFWGEGEGFWEREPFGWTGENGKEERWTRAVKLGALGGEEPQGVKKARWFYAFTLPPQSPSAALPVKPTNATPNPFIVRAEVAQQAESSGKRRSPQDGQDTESQDGPSGKRTKTERGPPPDTYVCRACNTPGHWIQECPNKPERDPSKPPPGYKCNICHASDHYIRECPERNELRTSKQPPAGYTCRACGAADAHFFRDCPSVADKHHGRNKRKEMAPEECWFCLSNPKVTKHLITAIGQETYVTLPKGQLIPTTPAHVAQGGSKPLVPGDAVNIIAEIESYKTSLRVCYEAYGAVPVVWEVGRLSGRGGHAHVQIVPVPKELASKVAPSFKAAGEHQGLDWEANPEEALSNVGSSGNYFKVECPDGTKLVHLLKGNFDLQFGRMVLGSLLGYQHRIDWKDCGQGEGEEKEDAQKFKKAFAPYNKQA